MIALCRWDSISTQPTLTNFCTKFGNKNLHTKSEDFFFLCFDWNCNIISPMKSKEENDEQMLTLYSCVIGGVVALIVIGILAAVFM